MFGVEPTVLEMMESDKGVSETLGYEDVENLFGESLLSYRFGRLSMEAVLHLDRKPRLDELQALAICFGRLDEEAWKEISVANRGNEFCLIVKVRPRYVEYLEEGRDGDFYDAELNRREKFFKAILGLRRRVKKEAGKVLDAVLKRFED